MMEAPQMLETQGIVTAARSARPHVSVDGVIIPHDQIAREAQHHAAPTPSEAYVLAARALVIRKLLLNRACTLGLKAEPLSDEKGRTETEDDALIRQLIEREVTTPEPDEASCRRYYTQNTAKFRTSDLYEASHILFAARPRDRKARQIARTDAEAVLATLKDRPQEFEALAETHSACISGRDGGRLGQLERGQTAPEIDIVLGKLDVGALSAAPVETRYGFHIVRLDRRVSGQQLSFEAVNERIAAYLTEASQRRALAQYIAILAGQSVIAGVALAGSSSPLVQ